VSVCLFLLRCRNSRARGAAPAQHGRGSAGAAVAEAITRETTRSMASKPAFGSPPGERGHLVLLGDSVFDNAPYVGGGPDVCRQVLERLPEGWQVTLRAVDGSTIGHVAHQLDDLPETASHLVLSVGGNDALAHVNILAEPAESTAQVLSRLADIADSFEDRYAQLLEELRDLGLPAAICTIYYPNFPDPLLRRLSVAALALFNDIILRQAFAIGMPVLDLRLICDSPADYANPIEPSVQGGGKIADVIASLVTGHGAEKPRAEVYI
jgi:hypothetical protein